MGDRANEQPNSGRTSHLIGSVGDGHFIAWASVQGWHLYRGFDGHSPCDYIADDGVNLLRVEVKRIESVQHTHNNYYYVTITDYDPGFFDYIFVSTPRGWYWIPSNACPRKTLSIKVVGDVYDRNITRPGKYEPYRIETVA